MPTRVHFLISPWPSLQPTPMGFIPIICTEVVLIKVITDLYLERTSGQFCILIWLHFSTASGSFLKHFLIFPSSFPAVCVLQGSVLHSLLFFFYVLLLNKFTLFHGFKYPFNADNSQMFVSNWSLFLELQIHISKYLLTFQFRCLIIILSLYDHNFPP